jgi:hypothetical protein
MNIRLNIVVVTEIKKNSLVIVTHNRMHSMKIDVLLRAPVLQGCVYRPIS